MNTWVVRIEYKKKTTHHKKLTEIISLVMNLL